MKCNVCTRKKLYPGLVRSGGTTISFQLFMTCDIDIRKKIQHGQGSKSFSRPRGLYTALRHRVYFGLFVVSGVAGMSGLIGSWRP